MVGCAGKQDKGLLLHLGFEEGSGNLIRDTGGSAGEAGLGQLNDNSYHQNPERCADSRYLHRGDFDWKKAELREEPTFCQGRLFAAFRKLEAIRASERVFRADAKISTFDTGRNCVLGVCRDCLASARTPPMFS